MAQFLLAVAQPPANLASPRQRLNWLSEQLSHLSADHVDMLLLPELFLTGYNIGELVRDWAEPSDGACAAEIAALAGRHNIAIHYGYVEHDAGRLFNAAQCIGPHGDVLGGHRKLLLPPGFEGDHFDRGVGCSLFGYRSIKFATLICWDAEFPETVRHVAAMGAEIVLVPTALGAKWNWVARTIIPSRAYENGVFLAYANYSGVENGLEYLGASLIASPDGEELARAGEGAEILVADIDVQRVRLAQERLPYLRDRLRLKFDE